MWRPITPKTTNLCLSQVKENCGSEVIVSNENELCIIINTGYQRCQTRNKAALNFYLLHSMSCIFERNLGLLKYF